MNAEYLASIRVNYYFSFCSFFIGISHKQITVCSKYKGAHGAQILIRAVLLAYTCIETYAFVLIAAIML